MLWARRETHCRHSFDCFGLNPHIACENAPIVASIALGIAHHALTSPRSAPATNHSLGQKRTWQALKSAILLRTADAPPNRARFLKGDRGHFFVGLRIKKITTIALGNFPARPSADRNAFLFFTALIWVGVLSGFGTDTFKHLSKYGLDYPLIVHFHAVAFVGWLVLFTVQVALIRTARADIHRKLGLLGAVLAVMMIVLGPATAMVVDAARFTAKGQTPEFLIVQFTDILAFAGLTAAGLLMRGISSAHKRLMLLGLIYISDAGFARFLNPAVAALLGHGAWDEVAHLYLGSDFLMLGLGVYDLATRGRLHPAYIAGVVWTIALQITALILVVNPTWKALSLHLIGH